jgi:diazepam-binding inhibitor (GABA receptor modulating acyl-CoA-binding protein)
LEQSAQFEEAVAASKSLSAKPDNETLLELYSLYKQATTGDAPEKGDYGMFDFVAKAKHEAWKKLSGTTKEDAMGKYIELVSKLQKQ